jgi:hypothetical protein
MDISTFNNKIDKLINLINYVNSKDKKYFKYKINKNEFIQNIYHLNKLVYELYKIYGKNISNKEKNLLIYNLRDINGNKFLSKNESKFILNYLAKPIYDIYIKLYDLRRNVLQKKNNIIMYGGNYNQIEILFNWIFFPLWSMENDPIVGEYFEIYLDILGLLFEYMDIFLEAFSQFAGIGISTSLDFVQAVPGVGTAASAIAVPLTIAEGPIQWLIGNFGDVIDLFINISRKQWGLAYMNALEVIPNLSNLVDVYIEQVYVANKWISKTNKRIEPMMDVFDQINNSISSFVPMFETVLQEPSILTNPEKIFQDFILPNYKNIPFMNKLSDAQIDSIKQFIYKFGKKINKLITNPLLYISNPVLFYNDIISPIINNNNTNNILENINKRMDTI